MPSMTTAVVLPCKTLALVPKPSLSGSFLSSAPSSATATSKATSARPNKPLRQSPPERRIPLRSWLDSCGHLLFSGIVGLSCVFSVDQAVAGVTYPCEDIARYYSGIRGLEGGALMKKLNSIVSVHHSLRYRQVWDALKILDAADAENPEASSKIIEIYSLRAVPKSLAGKPEGWNREHLWPRSYGLTNRPSLTDLYNIHPADVNVNSSRGNKYYGECAAGSIHCLKPANKEVAPDTETDKERWTPPMKCLLTWLREHLAGLSAACFVFLHAFRSSGAPLSARFCCGEQPNAIFGKQVRGDIARSLMYMAISYGYEQPNGSAPLRLSDSPSIEKHEMGLLSTLLEWNRLDPPSRVEQLRNDRICKLYQHNRNPFIDHPEYGNLIWKHASSDSSVVQHPNLEGVINVSHYGNNAS